MFDLDGKQLGLATLRYTQCKQNVLLCDVRLKTINLNLTQVKKKTNCH